MSDGLLLFIIVLSLSAGVLLGGIGRWKAAWPRFGRSKDKSRYLDGLAYMLKDQSDDAIDVFISSLKVGSDTLDAHLALGELLRKKGQVGQALKVHQNLQSSPELDAYHLQLVQLEVAIDFASSGLFDRAEALLRELVESSHLDAQLRVRALESMVDIYRDSRDWLLAIDTADSLTSGKFSEGVDRWRRMQAHFSCELAVSARHKQDWMGYRKWTRAAHKYDPSCARVTLLQAEVDIEGSNYSAAIAALREVPYQNSSLISETLPLLQKSYMALGQIELFHRDLMVLYEAHRDRSIFMFWLRSIELAGGCKAVKDALPSIVDNVLPADFQNAEAIISLVSIYLGRPGGRAPALTVEASEAIDLERYTDFKAVLDRLVGYSDIYRCGGCGFSGETMHWLCPSCKQWGTVAPSLASGADE